MLWENRKNDSSMQKRANRKDREQKILLSLVEYYLQTGKPVGSQALQEESLADMSSATIRNYFAALERDGYLKQQHLSSGRIPQAKAFVAYAQSCFEDVEHEQPPEKPTLP